MVRAKELSKLVDAVSNLSGIQIDISESISRSRDGGHDQHWSTHSSFTMMVRFVGVAISGSQLILNDREKTVYGIALDAVTRFDVASPNQIKIVEQFEAKTERVTTINASDLTDCCVGLLQCDP
jgi:hypothetical protein